MVILRDVGREVQVQKERKESKYLFFNLILSAENVRVILLKSSYSCETSESACAVQHREGACVRKGGRERGSA